MTFKPEVSKIPGICKLDEERIDGYAFKTNNRGLNVFI